jgi:hypothetical protein
MTISSYRNRTDWRSVHLMTSVSCDSWCTHLCIWLFMALAVEVEWVLCLWWYIFAVDVDQILLFWWQVLSIHVECFLRQCWFRKWTVASCYEVDIGCSNELTGLLCISWYFRNTVRKNYPNGISFFHLKSHINFPGIELERLSKASEWPSELLWCTVSSSLTRCRKWDPNRKDICNHWSFP